MSGASGASGVSGVRGVRVLLALIALMRHVMIMFSVGSNGAVHGADRCSR